MAGMNEHERDHQHERALHRRVGARVIVSVAVGVVAALATTVWRGEFMFSLMAGWLGGAALYCAWTWLTVRRFDAEQTRTHAREEDPSVAAADATVLVATVASLAGVGFLLAAGAHANGSGVAEAVLGAASVVASWFCVHVVYVLRYARTWYGDGPGSRGIEFEGGEPDYYDFAYVAFDLGMTYQISDTNLKNRWMRRLVLGHTLLSYLLGVGVVATTINLVTSLASS